MTGWFWGILVPTLWAISLLVAYHLGRLDEWRRRNAPVVDITDLLRHRRRQ